MFSPSFVIFRWAVFLWGLKFLRCLLDSCKLSHLICLLVFPFLYVVVQNSLLGGGVFFLFRHLLLHLVFYDEGQELFLWGLHFFVVFAVFM
jgi:hypothetical protein